MQQNSLTISKAGDQQLICNQRTQNLIALLTSQEPTSKLELAEITSELMPNGNPDFRTIRKTLDVKTLKYSEVVGRKVLRAALFNMVKSFCDSMNVSTNMNEDQMIEAASFLLDDCGDMRLEDYHIMFTMAKRGQLKTLDVTDKKTGHVTKSGGERLKFFGRIDIEVIGEIYDSYWHFRNQEGKRIQEEESAQYEKFLRLNEPVTEEGEKLYGLGDLVGVMTAWQDELDEDKEKEKAAMRERNKAAYIELQGLDLTLVVKDAKEATERIEKANKNHGIK